MSEWLLLIDKWAIFQLCHGESMLHSMRLQRRVPIVEQKLSLPPVFSGVRVTRSLVLCVCFVDRCSTFCLFYFGHCGVCPSCLCQFDLYVTLLVIIKTITWCWHLTATSATAATATTTTTATFIAWFLAINQHVPRILLTFSCFGPSFTRPIVILAGYIENGKKVYLAFVHFHTFQIQIVRK